MYFLRHYISQQGGPQPPPPSNNRDGTTVKKQTISFDRNNLFSEAVARLKQIDKRQLLEISFLNEQGTGKGPTFEFYNSIAIALKTDKKHIWRQDMQNNDLFPAPVQLP